MKKILKLLFVLSSTITIPLSVVACGQESLDSILSVIYRGDTKYDIKDFFNKETNNLEKTYTLTKEETNKLAKDIAEKILTKAEVKTPINWFSVKPVATNEKCYNFIINNGKQNESDESFTWDVDQNNARFTIKISYEVGTNENNKFVAKQKIDMSFAIKCGTSASDNIVENWVQEFNQKQWNEGNPIVVELSMEKIEIPSDDIKWSDLNKKSITKTYEDIAAKIEWEQHGVTWAVKNIESTIKNKQLKMQLNVTLNEALKTTDDFYIKFN